MNKNLTNIKYSIFCVVEDRSIIITIQNVDISLINIDKCSSNNVL